MVCVPCLCSMSCVGHLAENAQVGWWIQVAHGDVKSSTIQDWTANFYFQLSLGRVELLSCDSSLSTPVGKCSDFMLWIDVLSNCPNSVSFIPDGRTHSFRVLIKSFLNEIFPKKGVKVLREQHYYSTHSVLRYLQIIPKRNNIEIEVVLGWFLGWS